MRRGLSIVAAISASLGLAACTGSTEPATEVGTVDARLHARGTANNGPAYSFFDVWPTATPAARRGTSARHWPAGASGAFSDRVDYLRPATEYTFRVCGAEEEQPWVCANARTFTMRTPPGDVVKGSFAFSRNAMTVDATSGPAGQSPRGNLSLYGGGQRLFTGFVTCLAAQGSRAAIGAVGQRDDDPEPESVLAGVQVRAPGEQSDLFDFDQNPAQTPPDCAAASFATLTRAIGGELVVYDAP